MMGQNKKRFSRKFIGGFTLIELLVVISIIGLLSSVVMASVNTARDRAKTAAGKKFFLNTRSALYSDAEVIFDFDNGLVNTGLLGGSAVFNPNQNPSIVSDTTLFNRGGYVLTGSCTNYPTLSCSTPLIFTASSRISTILSSKNFTISFWYRPDNTYNGTNASIPLGDGNGSWGAISFTKSGGNVTNATVRFDTNNTIINNIPLSIKLDEWANILISVSNPDNNGLTANRVDLYLNGNLVASGNNIGSVAPGSFIGIGGVCCFSKSSGFYDEFYLFSTPLIASQVSEIYAEQKSKFLAKE